MIFFRVDGNEKIGLGHIMRCLSIAETLRNNKEQVCFVLADSKSVYQIKQKGFEYIILNSDYSNLNSELGAIVDLIDKLNPDTIIIDSYFVTEYYLKSIRENAKTVYIDDILAFAYPVDMLVNYNIFSSQDAYDELYNNIEVKPEFLLGTKYVPLRSEFVKCDHKSSNETVKRILISTGGADPQHIGLQFLEYLSKHPNNLQEYKIKFVIGSANKDLEKINLLAKPLINVELKIDVTNMCELMRQCDLAVSAAGSTLYELCACGIPTITYSFADNQILAAETFTKHKVVKNIGDARVVKDFITSIFEEIKKIIANKELRLSMIQNAKKITDGYGATRLSEKIIELNMNNTY